MINVCDDLRAEPVCRGAIIGVAGVVAAGVVALGLVSHSSGSPATASAGQWGLFSVFSQPAAGSMDDQVRAIADDVGADEQDRASFRTLLSGVGRFDSRLVAFRSMHGRNVCYALLAAQRTDPGMSYCYRPYDANAPARLAGEHFSEHFSVVAPESRTGPNLDVDTQVFGVAEDDVVSVRVLVAGSWQKIPIRDNGLFLDLPGVPRSDVGTVEATRSDGSMQRHDLWTGI
jgi:hypothetical protein